MSGYQLDYYYDDVPTLYEMLQDTSRHKLVVGPFGSGKSSGMVMEIFQRSRLQKAGPDGVARVRWAVVRNTYQQLSDTTMRTFFQWFPPDVCGKFNKKENIFTITRFRNFQGMPLVIEVFFRALDVEAQVRNLLSLELTAVWFNEGREIVKAIWDAADGRIGRYPAVREGGCTWRGMLMDTNPPDTESWIYKYWVKDPARGSRYWIQPAGLLFDVDPRTGEYINLRENKRAENYRNLDPGYYINMANGKDREYVKVYILGQWGFSLEGRVVYPEYREQTHFAPGLTKPTEGWVIVRAWDFGLTPACVFIQVSPRGQVQVFDELVTSDPDSTDSQIMGIDRFSDLALQHCAREYPGFRYVDVGDPAGMQKAQTDERSCFDIMRAKGINIQPGKQAPQLRLESVRKALTNAPDGQPGFLLGPKCKVLRKGFMSGYHYRRLKVAGERYADKPEKNGYSHPHDALQYGLSHQIGDTLTVMRESEDYAPIEQNEEEAWLL